MRIKISIWVILLLLITTLLSIYSVNGYEDSIDGPEFTFAFDDENMSIDVKPGYDGLGLLTGNITCFFPEDSNETSEYYLTLIANITIGSIMGSHTFHFTPEDDRTKFEIDFMIPIGTSSKNQINITLNGFWREAISEKNGRIKPLSIPVTVLPFYQAELVVEDYDLAEKGEWKDYKFEIVNKGNSDANFTLRIEKYDENLRIMSSNNYVIIPENKSIIQIIKIKREKGPIQSNMVTFYVESENGELLTSYSISHREKYNPIPLILIIIAFVIIVAISTVIIIKFKRKNLHSKTK